MILMWSCPGNMLKYYPGLRDILISPSDWVICLSDLGNILTYYLDMTTLLYKYSVIHYLIHTRFYHSLDFSYTLHSPLITIELIYMIKRCFAGCSETDE